MSLIELNNVSKTYDGNIIILQDVSLQIKSGCSYAITGNSGTGKSTLLHIAGLLDNPSSGKVFINGIDSENMDDKEQSYLRNSELGFVFQSHMLLDDYDAIENVMLPALIAGKTKDAEKRAGELLDFAGLSNRIHHFPNRLSGGEKQRIAICRALMNNPSVILADEPTGNLDEENAFITENLFFNLVKKENKALLLVTHNQSFASKCSEVFEIRNHHLNRKVSD